MKRGRIADSVKLVHELQLDALADVVGVGVGGAQLVLAQMDQISGAYRSMSASGACWSLALPGQ